VRQRARESLKFWKDEEEKQMMRDVGNESPIDYSILSDKKLAKYLDSMTNSSNITSNSEMSSSHNNPTIAISPTLQLKKRQHVKDRINCFEAKKNNFLTSSPHHLNHSVSPFIKTNQQQQNSKIPLSTKQNKNKFVDNDEEISDCLSIPTRNDNTTQQSTDSMDNIESIKARIESLSKKFDKKCILVEKKNKNKKKKEEEEETNYNKTNYDRNMFLSSSPVVPPLPNNLMPSQSPPPLPLPPPISDKDINYNDDDTHHSLNSIIEILNRSIEDLTFNTNKNNNAKQNNREENDNESDDDFIRTDEFIQNYNYSDHNKDADEEEEEDFTKQNNKDDNDDDDDNRDYEEVEIKINMNEDSDIDKSNSNSVPSLPSLPAPPSAHNVSFQCEDERTK
jgi:hypothetical protein